MKTSKKKIRAAIRRKCACCLPFILAGVVLWSEALGGAAPKRIVIEGPGGERTVTNVGAATTRQETHMRLVTSTGAVVDLTLPGRLAVGADGRYAFTGDQLAAFSRTVPATEMPQVLLLQADIPDAPQFADGPTPMKDVPLNPACGGCDSGKSCTVDHRDTCCVSGLDTSCLLCKTCAPAPKLTE